VSIVRVQQAAGPIEVPLEGRLEALETEIIPELERHLTSSDDELTHAALLAARREAGDIRDALERARTAADEPWDEQRIEVGDAVDVRESGADRVERFVLTWGGRGARVDDAWISDRSPLGKVLVGSRRGEVVEVVAPAGPIRYEIVDFTRAG
jgi:transcription elongation GreA/GreB family factor